MRGEEKILMEQRKERVDTCDMGAGGARGRKGTSEGGKCIMKCIMIMPPVF